ncbi:MAG TPA: hypothetical protein VJB92_02950 [Candidatus Paceibacterota bacterium]
MMQNFITERRRKSRWFKLRLKIYLLLALIILVGIGVVYVVREKDFFKIQRLEVIGLEEGDSAAFLAKLTPIIFKSQTARFLGGKNYFSWPSQIEFSDIEIASLALEKNLFERSIFIKIQKRERIVIWCRNFKAGENLENSKCSWIDGDNGSVLNEVSGAYGRLVPVIWEDDSSDSVSKISFLTQSSFVNFKKVLKGMHQLNLSLRSAKYNRELEELRIATDEGTELIFSLRFNPATSLFPALDEFLKKTPLARVAYLNLTVPNKIYVKNK